MIFDNFDLLLKGTIAMTPKGPEASTFQHPEVLKSLLNQEGFRLTSQRQKILELFEAKGNGQHLSAEEIHHALANQGEKISFSTIYRALHVLVGLGLLQEVELVEERKLYELNTPFSKPHHHLLCVHCGAFQEFADEQITGVSTHEALQRGFSLVNCQFTVLGVCPQCQEISSSHG
jgi:Fur family ferric uptake transcriptional regulator